MTDPQTPANDPTRGSATSSPSATSSTSAAGSASGGTSRSGDLPAKPAPRGTPAASSTRAAGSASSASATPPHEVITLDEATPEDAVALVLAGMAHDGTAVRAIMRSASHIALVALLAGMVERYGTQAYGSAEEFRAALARWQADPSATWPPSP